MKNILQAFKLLFVGSILFWCGCVAADQESKKPLINTLNKLSRNAFVVVPTYPKEALEQGIEGEVVFNFNLNRSGQATHIKIIKSEPPGVFDAEVLHALKDWLFLPDFTQPCTVLSARSQQHIWFEIKDAKPKISISKVQDVSRGIKTGNSIDAGDTELKPEFDIKTMEERYVLLRNSKIRYKKRPELIYPVEARRLGLRGYLIGMIDVLPGGKIDKMFFPFAVPDKFFKEAVESALKDAEFETTDGQPITEKTTVCQEFSFHFE